MNINQFIDYLIVCQVSLNESSFGVEELNGGTENERRIFIRIEKEKLLKTRR